MGFFVNDDAATKLKRMAMQFVQKVSSSGNCAAAIYIKIFAHTFILLYEHLDTLADEIIFLTIYVV